ncbi:C-type lectin domain family 4 member M-like [Patiria miniata]|uniref:C-type lectin domain-containing protein n=1 Tax=Patiria miniata TaxID=46514 RepID=A0A914ATY6_PATMI|nr:C-type lectin domain family 4 member M-like [Patiria miniata]
MAFWSKFIVVVAIISSIKAVFGSGFCPSRLSVKCHSRLIVECSCPPEWQLWGNVCYRLTPSPHTWDDAKSACQDMGGKMAAPCSFEEMNFMVELARNVESNFYAWIACNDKEVEGTWECDGQEENEPFLVWNTDQPDNYANDQDCVAISSDHNNRMDDDYCRLYYLAMCVRRAACTHGLTQLRD